MNNYNKNLFLLTVKSEIEKAIEEAASAYNAGITKGTNGCCELSNGLIIQWGYVTASSSVEKYITFPVSFTTDYPAVTLNHLYDGTTASTYTLLRKPSATGFYLYSSNESGNCWIAVGY